MYERIEKLLEYMECDADLFEDNCFYVDTDGDVHVCYEFDGDADTDLQIYIEKNFDINFEYDWFLFSLAHEVGHTFTLDYFDTFAQAMYKVQVAAIEDMDQDYAAREKYWNLDIEYAANEWAVNWLNDPEHLRVAREILYA